MPLTPKRQAFINDLFSNKMNHELKDGDEEELIPALKQFKKDIADGKFQNTANVITDYYNASPKTVPYLRLNKKGSGLPTTIILLDDKPYALLPAPKRWKEKKAENKRESYAVPKTLVSLVDGHLKFLKTFRQESPGDTYPAERALKEFKTLKSWEENVQIYKRTTPATETTPERKTSYILMDHYGLDLQNLISTSLLTASNMLSALSQAANQLGQIHARKELHLDVKPANIMYDPDTDKAKLGDAGEVELDQAILNSAKGTYDFMHPDRYWWMNGVRVAKKGNIQVCKGDDIFALLVTIEKMLLAIIPKEDKAACKALLIDTLNLFRSKTYSQFATDGSGTQARTMQNLPKLDVIENMLTNVKNRYAEIKINEQDDYMSKVPAATPASTQAKPSQPIVAPMYQSKTQFSTPKPALAPPQPQYHQQPQQYQQQPQFPSPSPQLPRPNYHYQQQAQVFPNYPSPRPNNSQQPYSNYPGFGNYLSPRPSELQQCGPSHHSPSGYYYEQSAYPPSPRLERREYLPYDGSPRYRRNK